jgi:hypothetical protein
MHLVRKLGLTLGLLASSTIVMPWYSIRLPPPPQSAEFPDMYRTTMFLSGRYEHYWTGTEINLATWAIFCVLLGLGLSVRAPHRAALRAATSSALGATGAVLTVIADGRMRSQELPHAEYWYRGAGFYVALSSSLLLSVFAALDAWSTLRGPRREEAQDRDLEVMR